MQQWLTPNGGGNRTIQLVFSQFTDWSTCWNVL